MKKRTIKDIKAALPDLESEKVEILSDELDKILAIKRVLKSDDGSVFLEKLKSNCSSNLSKIRYEAKNSPKLETLLGLIASYSANMDLLETFQDVSSEIEIRKQLDEAVLEAAR